MKFTQLPVGERFRWQDEMYRKTGPITAHAEVGGARKLVPRSAIIEPLENSAPATPATAAAVTEQQIRNSLARMNEQLAGFGAALPEAQRDALRRAIADARAAFLAELGL